MKNSKIKLIDILMFALVIHIFSVHSKLLYYLNPELTEKVPFSFVNFNEATILSLVFAVAYSLATYSVVKGSKNKSLIWLFGVLDSIGVLLYYFTKIPIYYGAIYFAVYTGTLIVSSMYLDKPGYISDQILEMKQKGVTQREIAQQLNISESKVSRQVKRVNGTNAL